MGWHPNLVKIILIYIFYIFKLVRFKVTSVFIIYNLDLDLEKIIIYFNKYLN